MMQVKPVSRSTGRSATAAAAYRSGTVIECEREGRMHDYTNKSGILKSDSQIILPNGIDAKWALDRNQLWNKAEHSEKRKDGRVAREYIIALPKEATPDERKQLVVDLSEYIANRYGVAVDMNIHAPHRSDEGHNENYHAHLLTTTRQVLVDGLGQKSEVELSDTDRFKRGLCLSKDEISNLRGHWAELQNQVLEKYGVQVSALSLENQGIDREPTIHMGADCTALERDGIETRIGDYNREIEARNLERLDNPLELKQEIIVSEQLLQLLEHDYAAQLLSIEPPKPSFDLAEIRARGAATFAKKNDERKAELEKQREKDNTRLMQEARERGKRAEELLKQQRIDRMFTQLGEVVERRECGQQGYLDTSLLWLTLDQDARSLIESASRHGVDELKKYLGTPSEAVVIQQVQHVLAKHDATAQQLTEQGRLFDAAVHTLFGKQSHATAQPDLKADKPAAEKIKDKEQDYGMDM